MNRFIRNYLLYLMLNLIIFTKAFSQEYTRVQLSAQKGSEIEMVTVAQKSFTLASLPLFTLRMNDTLISSRQFTDIVLNDSISALMGGRLKMDITITDSKEVYWKAQI